MAGEQALNGGAELRLQVRMRWSPAQQPAAPWNLKIKGALSIENPTLCLWHYLLNSRVLYKYLKAATELINWLVQQKKQKFISLPGYLSMGVPSLQPLQNHSWFLPRAVLQHTDFLSSSLDISKAHWFTTGYGCSGNSSQPIPFISQAGKWDRTVWMGQVRIWGMQFVAFSLQLFVEIVGRSLLSEHWKGVAVQKGSHQRDRRGCRHGWQWLGAGAGSSRPWLWAATGRN